MIDWANIPTDKDSSGRYYVVNLTSSFIKPTQHFGKVSPNEYFPFLKGVKEKLKAF